MAIASKYTRQMPFVGTPEQKYVVEREAMERGVSQADVVRSSLNAYFGLIEDMFPANDERAEEFAQFEERGGFPDSLPER